MRRLAHPVVPLALAPLALALAALAAPAAAQAPGERPIRVAINADIRSTDPGVNRDGNTDGVVLHMVEGLVALREDGSVGPLLAETMTVGDEGRSYTFRLRQGVRFHNGKPLTSEDVAWSWTRYLDPATKWRCQSEFTGRGQSKILAVETPDPRTVVFRVDKPSAVFLSMMARPDCGGAAIVHRDSVGADGKWVAPVGTGPFKLGTWKRGEYVELVRFDGYAAREGAPDGYTGGKVAKVPAVRFVVIPDPAAAKAALLSGSVDVLPDLSTVELPDMRGRQGVTVAIAPTMNVNTILLQTADPLLKDPRLRRAIAHAIDVKGLVAAVTQGAAEPNPSPIPRSSPFHGAAQKQAVPHDLAAAKRLLGEAGYRGQPIRILANKRFQSMFDGAVLAQAMLQQVGMNVEIEVIEWGAQLDRYIKGDYQVMSFSYSARLDPSLSYEMFSGPKATQPRKVWDDPEAQKLIQESMVTVDRVRRQAIFDELHRRMLDAVPIIVLYNGVEIAGVGKRVKGYKTWAAGQPRLWGVSLQ